MERWQLPKSAVEFCIPPENTGVRVDSGVSEGDEIGVFYDPMIAKVISKGQTRNQAIHGLHEALGRIQVGQPERHQSEL